MPCNFVKPNILSTQYAPSLKEPVGSVGRIGTVGGTLQVGQKEKGFIQFVHFGKIQDGTIESDENRNLDQTGQTTCQRIDVVLLIHFGNLLVHDFGVALVLVLHLFNGRLKGLINLSSVII